MSTILNPAWITDTVRSLAQIAYGPRQEIYVNQQYHPEYLPILADALEDAGCDNATLLTDLRSGTHTDAYDALWGDEVYLLAWLDRAEVERRWQQHEEASRNRAAREAKETRERKFAEARRGIAVGLGKSYHTRIADLYASRRGDVVYGSGGQEDLDWDAYGKRGKNYRPNGRGVPARWRNAGARITGYARGARVVVENHRGKVVARLPLPPKDAVLAGYRGLISGDLFAVERQIGAAKVLVRYGVTYTGRIATGYAKTGVAVQFPVPKDCLWQWQSLWGVLAVENETYWEHGATVADCRREYECKLELAAQCRVEQREAEQRQAEREREQRFARRISRLCPGLVVTDADRRQTGYCDAGTTAFLVRHNLVGRDTLTAAELRRTGDSQVERVIDVAARRVARERLVTAS